VEVREQATTWGTWPGEVEAVWSGEKVDRDRALQLLTVYGCVRLISDQIATMPVDVFRKQDGRRVEVVTPDWLLQPTTDLDFTAWCTQVLSSLLLEGNAYVAVLDNEQGRIVELVPLDPGRVSVMRNSVGQRIVLVNGQQWQGRMLHLKGMMLPGSDVGVSPVEYARQTIGLGLATVKHGSKFFAQGQQLSGVIEIPNQLTPDRAADIAKQWKRKHSGGDKAYLPGVLDGGATWKPTSVTNEQAQFLESRGFTAAEIAGQMFLVDPSDLGIGVAGSSLTYANLLERSTRRVQVTLLPWIVRLEHALSSLLAAPLYVKFNVDGLLRGSVDQRWSTYEAASRINTAAAGVGMGPVLTTAEMREYEDMGPVAATAATVTGSENVRKLNLVEAVQKVYLGVGTVLSADEARKMLNDMGADLQIPWPDAGGSNDARMLPMMEEWRSTLDAQVSALGVEIREQRQWPAPAGPTVEVHIPGELELRLQQPEVTVNVPAPIVNVPAPEVTVNVAAPDPVAVRSRRVERDESGRIIRVVEE
jgi:HK97 family phage portal protein